MATKTTPLYDGTHIQLKEVQMVLLKKYKRRLSIAEIVSYIVDMIKDPKEIAKKIMDIRHNEYKSGSGESNGNDQKFDNNSSNVPKSYEIPLIKEEDINV